jgi:integral membrane protein (TIGR01906 family)
VSEPAHPAARRLARWAAIAVAVLLPFVLILTNVRLLLSPVFVSLEYSTPGFPEDRYGFSRVERMRLAEIARRYLLNDAGPEFLGDLQDEAGVPLYNARELRHMVDVKRLVQAVLRGWIGLVALSAILGIVAWRYGAPGAARKGLRFGARITLVLMVGLVLLLVASFSVLFTGFQEIFFRDGTWVFSYSDTLIRLFPMRFWRDVFALLMVLTLAEASLILWLTRPKRDVEPA